MEESTPAWPVTVATAQCRARPKSGGSRRHHGGGGGNGGDASLTILNPNKDVSANITDYQDSNTIPAVWDFHGGDGGSNLGTAGNGGNSVGGSTLVPAKNLDGTGGNGGNVGAAGDGAKAGTITDAGVLWVCAPSTFPMPCLNGGAGGFPLNSVMAPVPAGSRFRDAQRRQRRHDQESRRWWRRWWPQFQWCQHESNAASLFPALRNRRSLLYLNGGATGIGLAQAADGGKGGSNGGAGGDIVGGNFGGKGGSLILTADNTINFTNALVRLNGGDSSPLTLQSGAGGNAGTLLDKSGNAFGGKGGDILFGGLAAGLVAPSTIICHQRRRSLTVRWSRERSGTYLG